VATVPTFARPARRARLRPLTGRHPDTDAWFNLSFEQRITPEFRWTQSSWEHRQQKKNERFLIHVIPGLPWIAGVSVVHRSSHRCNTVDIHGSTKNSHFGPNVNHLYMSESI
jgi:hypothetical protein